jgi:hypothetical protein
MKLSSILCASLIACAALVSASAFAGKPVVKEAGTPPDATVSANGTSAPGDCTKPPKKKTGGGGGYNTGSLSTYKTSSTPCAGSQSKPDVGVRGWDPDNKKPQ